MYEQMNLNELHSRCTSYNNTNITGESHPEIKSSRTYTDSRLTGVPAASIKHLKRNQTDSSSSKCCFIESDVTTDVPLLSKPKLLYSGVPVETKICRRIADEKL